MFRSRYAAAGVDIDAKAAALSRAKAAIRSTFTPGVLGDVGGFGGLFQPDLSGYREPVLVASTDGVGTKLKVAFDTGRHDSCGADLVNHCVNDILVQGAKALFFLTTSRRESSSRRRCRRSSRESPAAAARTASRS